MLKRKFAIKTKEFNSTEELNSYNGRNFEIAIVHDDGDSKPAQYQYYDSGWHKISDPDWGIGGGGGVLYPTYHDLSEQNDGINTIFTLPNPAYTDSIMLFVCGLAMKPGALLDNADYQITSSTEIEFYEAPSSGANIIIYYVEA